MPTTLTLEQIGLTQEELQQRVIEAIASQLLEENLEDEDGDTYSRKTSLHTKLREAIIARVDEKVGLLATMTTASQLPQYLNDLVFTRTNGYGEAKEPGEKLRAHIDRLVGEYLSVQVTSDGNTARYRDDKTTSRLEWILGKHVRGLVKEAIDTYLKHAGDIIAGDLREAVTSAIAKLVPSK